MSKKFNYYANDIDHAWYDSSNVVYSECIDHDDRLKTLKIVFSNGTQYQYDDVPVQDHLLFRESQSQGQALNRLIKGGKYKYQKLDNVDLEVLNEELLFRSGNGFIIKNDDSGFEIKNSQNEVVYNLDEKMTDENFKITTDILKSVGVTFKIND